MHSITMTLPAADKQQLPHTGSGSFAAKLRALTGALSYFV
jgi:hypothetical protein